MKMNFRYANSKREVASTTFVLFSLFYFVFVQGLRHFMVPDLGPPIAAIYHDDRGYYAKTARQAGRQPYDIALTPAQYGRFERYGNVQLVFIAIYCGLILLFRRYYYDPKRWPRRPPSS